MRTPAAEWQGRNGLTFLPPSGYLLGRGGVHQVAYARALELLTGIDITKAFPAPRIPTDKIPERKLRADAGFK